MKRGNRRYAVMLFLIFAALAGYTAFWFYALDTAKQGFAAAVAAERAQGNRFEFTSVEWGGFPVRIGATLTGLKYTGRGYELEADRLLAEVLPWRPGHALVRADGHVRLAARAPDRVEWIEFRPVTALASIRVTSSGALEGADAELREVRSDGTDFEGNDFSFNAARLQFDAVQWAAGSALAGALDVAFSADTLLISDGFAPALGPKISTIRMAGRLDNPGGAAAADPLASRGPARFTVARLDFDWGGVSAKGKGALALDGARRPAGSLDFTIVGLGKLIEALRANGTLQAPPGVSLLPDVPGGTPIALAIKDGVVTFGPFTVGTVGPLP